MQNHYTMCAENQAAPKETFDFQAMGCRYNAPRSGGKTAYAGLNSANAESLYHTAEFHVQIFGAQEKEKYPPGISPFLALIS